MRTLSTRPLRVGVLPFDRKNPYQALLGRELEARGVRLRPMRRSWLFALRDPWIWRADVLHLHWLDQLILVRSRALSVIRTAAVVVQLAALRVAGVRIVWTRHNTLNHERLHPFLEEAATRIIARFVSGIIVHCQRARVQALRELSPRPHAPVLVVPHGHFIGRYPNDVTRDESRRRLGISEAATVFLLFGGLRDYKGVPDLVEAFETLEGDDVRLLIAGAARRPATIASLEAVAEADPRILFHPGFVPDEGVQVFMNAADLVVLPYRDIQMSSVAMLALSFGRACIVPTRGCLPEILTESCAFLYDPDDPRGLSAALQRARAERDALPAMGARATRRAEQYDWATAAEITVALYRPELRAVT